MGAVGRWYERESPPSPPVWRRLFHLVAGSGVPLAAFLIPRAEFLLLLGALAAGSLGLDLIRFRLGWLNRQFLTWFAPLLKSDEDRRITGATYLVLAGFVAFVVFDPVVAVLAMFYLSLGDPSAALVGRAVPGPRFWGKSPVGTVAFLMASLAALGVLVGVGWVNYHWAFALGAVVAALVELSPITLDDNLTIPLISGAVMQLVLTVL